jgi:hypothetical protein
MKSRQIVGPKGQLQMFLNEIDTFDFRAATSAQRIQSVYSTLAVDILKMGMWLCLDAIAARTVYRQLLTNPHIPEKMLLMPIGIVEPWNAFVDNRKPDRTPRARRSSFPSTPSRRAPTRCWW